MKIKSNIFHDDEKYPHPQLIISSISTGSKYPTAKRNMTTNEL